jgi:hypothetical protein
MDAAVAAAMSDPERNPHFRRRWDERRIDGPVAASGPVITAIGTLGLALQEAMRRAKGPTNAIDIGKAPECPSDG